MLGGDLKPVTQPQERAMIQAALEKTSEFADAVKGKKKVVASTMVRYRDKPEGAPTESEFVETLHFDYDGGKTIRTVYNLTDNKVVKLQTLEAYPTPLAEEELAEARKLAADKDERVKALLRKYKEEQITVGALAPVVSERKNKDFGKRIAILQLTPKEKLTDTVTVTVNLTDQTVSRE
jgi:Cu2+-containing amine oxidase